MKLKNLLCKIEISQFDNVATIRNKLESALDGFRGPILWLDEIIGSRMLEEAFRKYVETRNLKVIIDQEPTMKKTIYIFKSIE